MRGMKTLYIIGDKDSEFVIPFRVSTDSAVRETERVWATLSSERIDEFAKDIDDEFASYALGDARYDRSIDVAIHFLFASAWSNRFQGREFTIEVFGMRHRGFTTTLIRRETPKTPES